jgi:hypothetical protein
MKSIHNNESVPSRSQTDRGPSCRSRVATPNNCGPAGRCGRRQGKACDLWKKATQTVLARVQTGAGIMLVGEQPGDQEDRSGRR